MNNLSTMMREIEGYLTPTIIDSAKRCAQHLLAYGGGKDSSYMVAYVRYIQGLIWQAQ
ncbi:hypothetical protein [Candidatus Pantoea persica]|uniref:hypothetical protein n=1 Tax=Candidatus Pantoea persica TaxID=2518128 RepID=UPI00215D7E65|nr:hypothetical protein [Candidatus Pantoea persica]MBA2817908.1 hypothetical protein [Candidatus Pantoea persica]